MNVAFPLEGIAYVADAIAAAELHAGFCPTPPDTSTDPTTTSGIVAHAVPLFAVTWSPPFAAAAGGVTGVMTTFAMRLLDRQDGHFGPRHGDVILDDA